MQYITIAEQQFNSNQHPICLKDLGLYKPVPWGTIYYSVTCSNKWHETWCKVSLYLAIPPMKGINTPKKIANNFWNHFKSLINPSVHLISLFKASATLGQFLFPKFCMSFWWTMTTQKCSYVLVCLCTILPHYQMVAMITSNISIVQI